MEEAESKLMDKLPAIETALDIAIADAAGERMAYILIVTPQGRNGYNIITTNIDNLDAASKILAQSALDVLHIGAPSQGDSIN